MGGSAWRLAWLLLMSPLVASWSFFQDIQVAAEEVVASLA